MTSTTREPSATRPKGLRLDDPEDDFDEDDLDEDDEEEGDEDEDGDEEPWGDEEEHGPEWQVHGRAWGPRSFDLEPRTPYTGTDF